MNTEHLVEFIEKTAALSEKCLEVAAKSATIKEVKEMKGLCLMGHQASQKKVFELMVYCAQTDHMERAMESAARVKRSYDQACQMVDLIEDLPDRIKNQIN